MAIGSNGTLYFVDDYLGLSNVCIPGIPPFNPQTFVAGYWDDLNPAAGGAIYYGPIFCDPCRDTFVVQWQDVQQVLPRRPARRRLVVRYEPGAGMMILATTPP